MDNKLPDRKTTHLKKYDYSNTGVYFVTICIEGRKRILSEIIRTNSTAVGEGLAPPENEKSEQTVSLQNKQTATAVGEGLAPPETERINPNEILEAQSSFSNNYKPKLTPIGEIAKAQIMDLERRYDNVKIKNYVIMPDHIHAVIFLHKKAGGASPSPTLHDVVCAFKSLTSRECKKEFGVEKMFQRSFAEHVIRDREDYDVRLKYIRENPMRWYYRENNAEKMKID